MNGGKNPADYKRIKTNNDEKILAFEREKNGKKIVFIANLSDQTVQTVLGIKGKFIDYVTGNKIDIYSKDAPMGLKGWQYLILIPE